MERLLNEFHHKMLRKRLAAFAAAEARVNEALNMILEMEDWGGLWTLDSTKTKLVRVDAPTAPIDAATLQLTEANGVAP